ncbi:MAG: hypothetical protein ACLR08_01800 [Dorea longicatena]
MLLYRSQVHIYYSMQEELSGKTRGDKSFGPAYAAAGGTLGTVLGALSALIFVGFIFLAYHKVFKKKMKRDHSGKRESYRTVYKVLFVTIAPCHFKCNGI